MILNLPLYVYLTFAFAVLFSLVMFYYASNKNLKFIALTILWGSLHSFLAISGFYENTKTIPPRFMLIVFPIVVIIISTIFSKKMRTWLRSLNLKLLTYLHIVRIPVELVLFWLFVGKFVPELITFEGRNFDIIAGISAPIIAFFSFSKDKINTQLLLAWNIMSILLLGNVLIHAVLSTPTVLQQFAFDQPNVAVYSFPFLLLPIIIVPLVLISNLAGLVQKNKPKE